MAQRATGAAGGGWLQRRRSAGLQLAQSVDEQRQELLGG